MKSYFEIKDFSVSYGKKRVVKDVFFAMSKGEFNALIGLNGCGKSTLLKGILGLETQDGKVILNDEDITHFAAKQKAQKIAYVAQRSDITYSTSVKDVLEMSFNPYLKLMENIHQEQRDALLAIANEFEIYDFLKQDILTLSGGQRQLVMIARAILQNSEILLLDEPDSALDFLNRHEVLQKIKKTLKSNHTSGLITIHDPNYALAYCDKAYLMKDGTIIDCIDCHLDTNQEIKMKLQKIYGNIDVMKYQQQRYMVLA